MEAGGPPLPNLIDDLSVGKQWIDSLYGTQFHAVAAGTIFPATASATPVASPCRTYERRCLCQQEQWARWSSPFTAFDQDPVQSSGNLAT